MKILYTTDLHGNLDKYSQLEEVVLEHGADVVINGGDMLSRSGVIGQRDFIENELREHFDYFEEAEINYLCQLANDDYRANDGFFQDVCDEYEVVHNVAGNKVVIGDHNFIGYNNVCDYMFRLKDRTRLDTSNDVPCTTQFGTGLLSAVHPPTMYEIPDLEEYFAEELTIEEELALLPLPDPDCKLVYAFHQPPAKMGLDVCYDGREVGSHAVREFLMSRDAMFSLHGHIHESHEVTGIWRAVLGKTVCIQPGQLEQFVCVIVDTEVGSCERFVC